MPLATTCFFNGQEVVVEEALRLRDLNAKRRQPRLDFRCIDCSKAVKPHKDGTHGAAHFEHFERNADCPLSDPARR